MRLDEHDIIAGILFLQRRQQGIQLRRKIGCAVHRKNQTRRRHSSCRGSSELVRSIEPVHDKLHSYRRSIEHHGFRIICKTLATAGRFTQVNVGLGISAVPSLPPNVMSNEYNERQRSMAEVADLPAFGEREIWRAATSLIDAHGEHAALYVLHCADLSLEVGNVERARRWRLVWEATQSLMETGEPQDDPRN